MHFSNAGGTQSTLERFLPLPPATVYPALVSAVKGRAKLKGSDDFTFVVNFSSHANLLTWGENYSAQVLPAAGGSLIRIQAASKFNGPFEQNSRMHKLVNQLFDDVVSAVRPR